MTVNAEKRLWAVVVLQAIAEQDEQNVVMPSHHKYRSRLAQEARDWVASEAFDEACEIAGFDASSFRKLTPQQAEIAREKLARGDDLKEESNEEIW